MARLIDADDLKEKKVYSHERHEKVVSVAEIDWMPTIDAIPVAWLEEKLNATAVTNPDLNNAIFYVLVAWEQQKQNHEQEAR